MSKHGLVTLDFGDGSYDFRLSLGGIEELEAKTEVSVFEIATRLRNRVAHLKEISETLRIALIGGGKAPVEALALVRRYVDQRPLDENRDVAYAVVLAGLARVHADEVKTAQGEEMAEKPNGSTSPPSAPAH